MRTMASDWSQAYSAMFQEGGAPVVPSETVVRLMSGAYLTEDRPVLEGKSVVEVGFGSGNNLGFFCSRGMTVAGAEVHQDICDSVTRVLSSAGYSADLKVGTNDELPFDDDSFDYLVSWNVLHYSGSEEAVERGIAEYARVLKPGGRFFLSTTAPENSVLVGSTLVGPHRYRIGSGGGFRKGQVHFFFDTPAYIEHYFGRAFENLRIGRLRDDMFNKTNDFWLVSGTKPAR